MNARLSQFVHAIISATLVLTATSAMGSLAPAPPTFGNSLELSLSARSLTGNVNGAPVSTWTDTGYGTLGLSATALGTAPTFVTSAINGQAALNFNNSPVVINSSAMVIGTVVIVASYSTSTFGNYPGLFDGDYATLPPNNLANDGYLYLTGLLGTSNFAIGSASHTVTVNDIATSSIPTLNQFNAYAVTDSSLTTGSGLDTQAGGSYFNGWLLGQDRNFSDRRWNGDIAEVLIYDQVLTSSQFHDVYLYLDNVYDLNLAPEPASLGILSLAGGLVALRRRRRCGV